MRGVEDLRTRVADAIERHRNLRPDDLGDHLNQMSPRAASRRCACGLVLTGIDLDSVGSAWTAHLADSVIRELKQEWRADFGYDGYAKCETRDEAKAQVDEFNEALGDDIRDGEQAIVMHRYVTDWKADGE